MIPRTGVLKDDLELMASNQVARFYVWRIDVRKIELSADPGGRAQAGW